MDQYLFEGEIQGKYRVIHIFPVPHVPRQYQIRWDGFHIGTLKKVKEQWYTDDEPLIEFAEEIGQFINRHEDEIKRGG